MMSTYTAKGTITTIPANLDISKYEQYIYGSSRLGMYNYEIPVKGGPADMEYYSGTYLMRGYRQYELSNHLGNVLSTISDKKINVASEINSSLIAYYNPDIVSAQDYYPFGMVMRVQKAINERNNRFGFNGQEMSNEIKGWGNSYTAEFWEYDPRIGRRWNLDPKPTPGLSQYSAFNNSPIIFSDPLGDTIKVYGSAQATRTTLSDKGGTADLGGNAMTINDARLVPAVDPNNNNKLIGYNVFDTKNKDRSMPVMQIEPGDVEDFRKNYSNYMDGARLYYSAGEPSDGVKKYWAAFDFGRGRVNWSLALEGLMEENKKAWSDPVFAVSFLAMAANSGITHYESSLVRNAQSSVSTKLRTQKQKVQHTLGGSATVGKSTMGSIDDAQKVLDALHSGKGQVLLVNPSQNRVFYYYNEVTGNFIHHGSSAPTNVFMIKGASGGATVVPINPIRR